MVTVKNWLRKRLSGKESASAGVMSSIPGSGRSSGEGNGNPLQFSCLEKPMDCRAWQVYSMGSQRVGYDLATEHCIAKQKLVVARGFRGGEGGMNGRAQRILRAVKLFCVIMPW